MFRNLVPFIVGLLFAFQAMSCEAQSSIGTTPPGISIYNGADSEYVIVTVTGSEVDDSVWVIDSGTRTTIYLFSEGALVDSMYFSNPLINYDPSNSPLFGGTNSSRKYFVAAHLKGGDDFFYSNAKGLFVEEWVYTGTGSNVAYGSDGRSFIGAEGDGQNKFFGGGGVDSLRGGDGNDELYGGAGDDYILGLRGDDTIFGDAGNDRLIGGPGFDWIVGGPGSDSITHE